MLKIGAYDGERYSNTLDLELRYNWTGVLIEVNSQIFQALQGKERLKKTTTIIMFYIK
jgi:hypothetical protein